MCCRFRMEFTQICGLVLYTIYCSILFYIKSLQENAFVKLGKPIQPRFKLMHSYVDVYEHWNNNSIAGFHPKANFQVATKTCDAINFHGKLIFIVIYRYIWIVIPKRRSVKNRRNTGARLYFNKKKIYKNFNACSREDFRWSCPSRSY